MEVGELATPGREFMEVVDIDRVKVVAGVPERHLKYVSVGTRAALAFPAYPDVSVEADVTYVGTTLHPDSRTVPVEITLDNPDHLLNQNGRPRFGRQDNLSRKHRLQTRDRNRSGPDRFQRTKRRPSLHFLGRSGTFCFGWTGRRDSLNRRPPEPGERRVHSGQRR